MIDVTQITALTRHVHEDAVVQALHDITGAAVYRVQYGVGLRVIGGEPQIVEVGADSRHLVPSQVALTVHPTDLTERPDALLEVATRSYAAAYQARLRADWLAIVSRLAQTIDHDCAAAVSSLVTFATLAIQHPGQVGEETLASVEEAAANERELLTLLRNALRLHEHVGGPADLSAAINEHWPCRKTVQHGAYISLNDAICVELVEKLVDGAGETPGDSHDPGIELELTARGWRLAVEMTVMEPITAWHEIHHRSLLYAALITLACGGALNLSRGEGSTATIEMFFPPAAPPGP